MDVKNIVITAVFGLLSLIIIRFWDYMWKPFKVADDMDLLIKRMANLKDRLEDVKVELRKAELEQKTCIHEVKGWMERVESFEGDVNRIGTKYSEWRSNYRGIYSYLIFWKRISISYQVFRKLKEVTELRDQAAAFKDVATEMPPHAAQEMPSTPRVRAMESNRDQILHQLCNNEEVEIIGIWGMGGVGKTTLLKSINNYFANHNGLTSFDRVIFVVASKNIGLEDLQVMILENLGLPSMGNSNINYRATILLSFMNRNKVLLLLDDLWEFVELHRLGIPLGHSKCKVVFTTRAVDVCYSMQAGMKLKVECLNKEEAWNLFKEKVGENIIDSDPNIGRIAKEVAKECRGLPLALVTVGRAMSAKKTLSEWRVGLCSLRNSKAEEISDIPDKMFPTLEFSYQNLQDDMMRECFLSCSLWPKDSVISRDELIKCWMGLELIDEYNEINEAFDRGHAIIETLTRKCLLECDSQNHVVKMHDVLRDLALWIATDRGKNKKKWIVKATKWTQRWVADGWESAERISVMSLCKTSILEKLLNCPRLSVLIMPCLGCDSIPGGVFQCWSALTYLDLSYSHLTCLPTEIAKLVNLKFLDLEHSAITGLPSVFSGPFLKYLSLAYTYISRIPWGFISQLSRLKVLDLFSCYGDLEKDGLEALEKLDGNLMALGINIRSLSALNRLSMLQTVSIVKLLIHYLDPNDLDYLELLAPGVLGRKATGGSLKALYIRSCKNLKALIVSSLHIGVDPEEISFPRLQRLQLCGLPQLEKIVWSAVTAKTFLPSLHRLVISTCDKLKNVSWVSNLPNLNYLSLSFCNELEKVIDDGEDGEEEELMSMFPRLRMLMLSCLPNLRKICRIRTHFPSLRSVGVTDCSKLTELPFQAPNIPRNLCRIGGSKEWWEHLEWGDDNTKTMLQDYLVYIS